MDTDLVSDAMRAFRDMAIEVRNYYACVVGGLKRKPNTHVKANELRDFLSNVPASLAQKIKDDGHAWTWETLCEACQYVPRPIIDNGRYLWTDRNISVFLERDDLVVEAGMGSVTKNDLALIQDSYYDIFRRDAEYTSS